jgi:hypothetical protein
LAGSVGCARLGWTMAAVGARSIRLRSAQRGMEDIMAAKTTNVTASTQDLSPRLDSAQLRGADAEIVALALPVCANPDPPFRGIART